jgi:hypothetical protein
LWFLYVCASLSGRVEDDYSAFLLENDILALFANQEMEFEWLLPMAAIVRNFAASGTAQIREAVLAPPIDEFMARVVETGSFNAKRHCLLAFCYAVTAGNIGEALGQFPTTFTMMPDFIGKCDAYTARMAIRTLMTILEAVERAPGHAADEVMGVLAAEEMIAAIRDIIDGGPNVPEASALLELLVPE